MKGYVDFLDIFIEIKGSEDSISSIKFVTNREDDDFTHSSEVAKGVVQLNEYLLNKRKYFDLNLALNATKFNSKVYECMKDIEYGTTISYKQLAINAGSPNAYRAVGNANNKNNFVIVIPCHRVVGSSNKLVGFAPGLKYKEYLLKLEGKEKYHG